MMTNREQEVACLGESDALTEEVHCASKANRPPSVQRRHMSVSLPQRQAERAGRRPQV
jgi:hypothetical protein